jgi:hypothetical protein
VQVPLQATVNNETEKSGFSGRSNNHTINQQVEMRPVKKFFTHDHEDRFYSVQGHFVVQTPVADTIAHNLQVFSSN